MNNKRQQPAPDFETFIVLLLHVQASLLGGYPLRIAQTQQGLAGHNVGWLAGRPILLFLLRCRAALSLLGPLCNSPFPPGSVRVFCTCSAV